MKKILFTVLSLLIALCSVLSLSSCEEAMTVPEPDTDLSEEETGSPAESHSSVDDSQAHTHSFGEWTVLTEATCEKEGVTERTCPCGQRENGTILPVDHVFKDGSCTVCGKADPDAFIPDYKKGEENAVGSYLGSMSAASQGKWIYTSFSSSKIVKLEKTGKNMETVYTVSGGFVTNVNVVGDYIYFFVQGSTQNASYIGKVRTDGLSFEKVLSKVSVSEMLVVGDTILFTTIKDPYNDYAKDCCPLYSVSVKGGMTKQIYDGYVSALGSDGSYVYFNYAPQNGKMSICRMKPDGTKKSTLYTGDMVMNLVLAGGKLYFAQPLLESDGVKILSIPQNGGTVTTHLTTEFFADWQYVSGTKLYYVGAKSGTATEPQFGIVEYDLSSKSSRIVLEESEIASCLFVSDRILMVEYGTSLAPRTFTVFDPSTRKWTKDLNWN